MGVFFILFYFLFLALKIYILHVSRLNKASILEKKGTPSGN